MKTKKLNFQFDVLSETHVFVVLVRFFKGEWQVLLVEHDAQSAIDSVQRWMSECDSSFKEYKIVETELF